MGIKYLYIDDNARHIVEGQVSALNIKKEELEVIYRQPFGDWEAERKYFIDDFSKEYDGLILDLRLDDEKNSEGNKSDYRGTSLAQELRTLSTEKAIKEAPIILLSANEKINESLDNTGEDLFDFRIPKEKMVGDFFNEIRTRLIDFAKAYKAVSDANQIETSSKWLNTLLSIESRSIDDRFIVKTQSFYKKPAHSLIGFILTSFLNSDGILISENTLAARLGVDKSLSKEWEKLISFFDGAKYHGILGESSKKWWSKDIEAICNAWLKEDTPFRNLDAEKRVELIKSILGELEILPAAKLQYSQSSAFWTICRGSGKPIDPIDGLLIENQDRLYPWQEKKYISIEEALHRRHVMKWHEISFSEIERLKKLQKLFARGRD